MTNEEKILKMLESLTMDVAGIKSDITGMKSDIVNMQTQLNEHNNKFDAINIQLKEHGAILGALQHASEIHKAEMDNLTHQVANLSQEVKAGFKELNETNKSLLEMYGDHEAQIRILRRRTV